MVHRVGLTSGERLRDEHVDRDAVLGVHHDHRPGLAAVLHGPQDLPVVGVEDARVRHEQLEAGDALVVARYVIALSDSSSTPPMIWWKP